MKTFYWAGFAEVNCFFDICIEAETKEEAYQKWLNGEILCVQAEPDLPSDTNIDEDSFEELEDDE